MKTLFLSILLFGFVSTIFANDNVLISIKLKDFKKDMLSIQMMDYDITGVDIKNNLVGLIVNPIEAQGLTDLGYNVVDYNWLNKKAKPDPLYKTPEEVYSILKDYEAKYPSLITLTEMGKSLEGKSIWIVKITNGQTNKDRKKSAAFFNSVHHARELMTTEVGLDIIDQLTTNYGKDDAITNWVDNYDIWVLPMFNVDGNNKVWTSYSMWRKNTRGGYGVDINRNYPYAWNACAGSSGSTYSDSYRGESPASEPETKVMLNFINKVRPVMSISYHSYSELVIYPYGCPDTQDAYLEVVKEMAREIAGGLVNDANNGEGYEYGTAYDLLYNVDGGDIDTYYHDYQVVPFVIEVNGYSQGFQPSYSKWRDSTVARNRTAWKYVLSKLEASGIRGLLTNTDGEIIKNGTINIYKMSDDNEETRIKSYNVNPDGSYHVILDPGKYRLVFEAEGLQGLERIVTIGTQRLDLDTTL